MEFDLTEIHVKSEDEFRQLIEQINTDIEFANYFQKDKPTEDLLDMKYLVGRYRALVAKENRRIFREKHDCQYCFYFESKRCKASKKCPLDESEKRKNRAVIRKADCLKDKDRNCPYGNETGTCFGFCLKKILSEHNGRKQKNVQNEEEKESG